MAKKLKASAFSNAKPQSRTHLDPAPDADRALADLRAWKQLLVARGNRLLELAVRDRVALEDRHAAVGKTGHPERVSNQ
jgi:hypothetical protein